MVMVATRSRLFPKGKRGKKKGCMVKSRFKVREITQKILNSLEARRETRVLQVIPLADVQARSDKLTLIGGYAGCDDQKVLAKAVSRAYVQMPPIERPKVEPQNTN